MDTLTLSVVLDTPLWQHEVQTLLLLAAIGLLVLLLGVAIAALLLHCRILTRLNAQAIRPHASQEHAQVNSGSVWTARAWVSSLCLSSRVADALALPAPSEQFDYVRRLTRWRLWWMLQRASLGGLSGQLWKEVQTLKSQAASTAAELNAKFAASPCTFEMSYGSLDIFYGGLDALIGSPVMKDGSLVRSIEDEHCYQPDSRLAFVTSNGTSTTSAVEFEFVFTPSDSKIYPDREGVHALPDQHRKPTPIAAYDEVLADKNTLLQRSGQPALLLADFVAGRLYTGPMYEKYNAALRAQSGNTHLKQRFEAICRGNLYVTSIHAVNSCVIKLSKLTAACNVYRGFSGATLPSSFWKPNDMNVAGGIEYGFSSMSVDHAQAMHYARGEASTVLEMKMGLVDRGAEMAWLSQYPHEQEVLFPPLLGMEVLRTRIDGGSVVVEARLTLNLTALTLEQVPRCLTLGVSPSSSTSCSR
jgi:NLR family CARD domain-containing protein 3